MQKLNQKELRIEKVVKRKGFKPYIKWTGCDDSSNRLIKKVIQMGQYFFKPKTSWVNRKVELDLFNHASKAVLKKQEVLIHQNLQFKLI